MLDAHELTALRRKLFPQELAAIDLGQARPAELRAHPLIGERLAASIVRLRRRRRLSGPEDLLGASAISLPHFEKLKRVAAGEPPVRPVANRLEVSKKRLHVGEKFDLSVRFAAQALIAPEIVRLRVRFPSGRRASGLYPIDKASARQGRREIRGLVSGEAGEFFASAEVFDAKGGSYRCSNSFDVFTRNPVSLYVWPNFYTQSAGAGAPRYDYTEKRWYCDAAVYWVNGTDRAVNLGREVTVRVTSAGSAVATFSFSLSANIVIPPWTTLYGTIVTSHGKASPIGSRFHNKGNVMFEYEMSGDGHTVRRRQIWRTMAVIGYNLIRVGDLTQAQRDGYRHAAAEVASGILNSGDLSVFGVELYRIEGTSAQDADKERYRFINDKSEALAMMAAYTVPNRNLDAFLVEGFWDGALGHSPVNGTVDKQGSASGIVIRNDDDAVNLGQTFAHETGHYLGLEHADEADGCADTNPGAADISDNFIYSSSRIDSAVVTPCQMSTMRKHGLVRTLTP